MAKIHNVEEGDCISSIAFENGFFPETLWNHANNQTLKEKRIDMNVLMPGDAVYVPDKRIKKVAEPVDGFYRFKYKGVPARLNLVIKYYGEPCRSEPYKIDIDGRQANGTTGADGEISIPIPPDAKKGKLVVGEGDKQVEYVIDLGRLAPIDEVRGFKQRLVSLGYDAGELDDELSEVFKESIRMFEAENGMEYTGEINDNNKAKLLEVYGR
jgi:hypothetical protein